MRAFLTLFFFFFVNTGYTQKVIDLSKSSLPNTSGLYYAVGGQPFSNYKFVKLTEGTPYFKEEWMGGKVILSNGFAYDSVYLRLDLMDHTLHYLEAGGKEMISTSPVKLVILSDSVSGKKYRFVHSAYLQASGKMEPGWYELLAEGQATLYKRYVKTIHENKPYGAATTEQRIATFSNYFILEDSVFIPVRKFRELPVLLKGKKEELKSFISSNYLSGKTDADYITLLSFYNSRF